MDFKERFNIKQIGEFYAASEGNRGFFNLDGTVGAVGTYPPLMKVRFKSRLDRWSISGVTSALAL